MFYKMTVTFNNEEVKIFNVPFGAHDLTMYMSHELDAIVFDDENDEEQVIFNNSIQRITFSVCDDD